ncbi:MAG: acyl-CoA dehydrogenase family protein [Gemmatimonadetes bacterium]|nr:acyl-CoA dehydrogenase family protein [Gemmatimonadota bacterium]MCY3611735.1 acyl-CoA dehydrogenase family protein [Gemmatimonadota bacterium]MCY3677987.1 acyl-CoA dehydrogenase family protein [Gemmatimonadota bacterium]MYA43424.1 acyl-CoA dehydrogenase [Gemmatimonadota bacterium]MYE95472.1 acyl-CoA dehydrogenase [Gemmatimonadota bacterium]
MFPYLDRGHINLQAEVRRFALEAIAPVARELDETGRFPWDNVKAMAERGWFGVPVPRELSGMGLDYLSYALVVEELARHDASHAITVSAHTTLGTSPILAFGSDAQKERFIPLLASGQVLGGFGLTEPGAGSDASGTRTRAVPVDGGHSITGSKIFITHAGVGEIFVVTAVTTPGEGHRGITSFIVCKPTIDPAEPARVGVGHRPELPYSTGVTPGAREDKLGWRASDTRELHFQDAWVSEDQQLGAEGEGFTNFMRTLDAGRIGIAALSLGIAQGALDEAVRYTSRRRQFKRPVWDFQDVRFSLAELAAGIQGARHLTYHAAWLKERGLPFAKEAAMAKLTASELAAKSARIAVQALGGAGYTADHPVERMMRDAKACEIGEGTSEIQKTVIARHLAREYAS